MKKSNKLFYAPDLLKNGCADWYEAEANTASLLKAVVSDRSVRTLSADDLHSISRLTWITKSAGAVSEKHWKTQKLPALAQLYGIRPPGKCGELPEAIQSMALPQTVSTVARQTTGAVNFYNAYRNSCRGWLQDNRKNVIRILEHATQLDRKDRKRLDLAERIEKLPPLLKPSGTAPMSAASLITPVVAFLDPYCRFPIVNGRKGVNALLRKSGMAKNDSLVNQVRALLGWIGQFGFRDAFMIDVLAAEIPANIRMERERAAVSRKVPNLPTRLPLFDELERKAVLQSQERRYRTLHNRMTNSICSLLRGADVLRSTDPDQCYDALVKNYDHKGRDLLIEAKPSADRGSIRMAIGQLFDYRRRLKERAATDLAILTMSKPDPSYMDLLLDLQITPIWFQEEECQSIRGNGLAWAAMRKLSKRR